MLSFFRRGKSAGKREDARGDGGNGRTRNDQNKPHFYEVCDSAPDRETTTRKDVVNLLIPPTEYAQKTGVAAIIHNIMAGKRRNKKRKKQNIARAESFKEISTGSDERATNSTNLYRSHSHTYKDDVCISAPVSETDLTYDVISDPPDAAFVKELVLSKYRNKPQRQHVSLVYVSDEPEQTKREERQHAELLLREIAKKINCDLNEQMGAGDSKSDGRKRDKHEAKDEMASIKDDLKSELHKLLNSEVDRLENESAITNVAVTDDSENKAECNYQSENETIDHSKNKQVNLIDVDPERHDCESSDVNSSGCYFDCKQEDFESDYENEVIDTACQNFPKDEGNSGSINFLNNNNHNIENFTNQCEDTNFNEISPKTSNPKTQIIVTHNEDKVNDRESAEENILAKVTEFISAESSPSLQKKSNLKPPRSDTEGASDDDRSDGGTKRVTFRKTIEFDDGDEQSDVEFGSSFESLTSSEEEDDDVEVEEIEEIEEEEEEEIPDNDECLGGVVVARNDELQSGNIIKTSVIISEPEDAKPSQDGAHVTDSDKKCESDKQGSDNSDSGFCERVVSAVETDSETEEVTDEEGEVTEEEEDTEEEDEPVIFIVEPDSDEDLKNLVSQEDALSAQVARLNELASGRGGEADRLAGLISTYRKDIETKDHEIERLKSEVGAAYKECELIRQRSRSLEEELIAARSCSADLAGKLTSYNDDTERSLRAQLQSAHARIAELEARLAALEKERSRLQLEKQQHQQKAAEAVAAAEASSARWKAAHEAARSQAAATAERLLADCEWKMRELEKRARDAEKLGRELAGSLEKSKAEASSSSQQAELQQLRGLLSEQQRSVQALSSQLLRVEAREDALKVEVHRLKQLLDKEAQIQRDKDEKHLQAISRLEVQHGRRVETLRAELTAQHAATRATVERAHAEKTRAALAQLRAEHERDARNCERKMREQQNKYDSLQQTLEERRAEHEQALAEAHSRADWELLQLRHLLDKSDISHANSLEQLGQRHEEECERLNAEWSERLRLAEEAATLAAGEARTLLETTRSRLEAERTEQVNRLKDTHRKEMDEQWENFMRDKEACLARMKLECRQEGEEERVKREKDLLEEIADLKSQIATKVADYGGLESKTAACERTLAVTEQELREALEREKELRTLRSEDAEKLKQARSASRNEVEHLQRKCACVRKLFDDMRARLASREKSSAEEARSQQREIQLLKNEVARLTKLLMQSSAPKSQLGARTRADGCDSAAETEAFLSSGAPPACESPAAPPRRKGGTLRTPELRRRAFEPVAPLDLPALRPAGFEDSAGRRRAKSVDLPAVQVPVRIKQLEEKGVKN